VGNVTDDAADRALRGELQRLLVGLGIMPVAPKLRRRHWLLAAGALAGLAAAVVTVTVTRESRLAS
jgi:hypothetical protein